MKLNSVAGALFSGGDFLTAKRFLDDDVARIQVPRKVRVWTDRIDASAYANSRA